MKSIILIVDDNPENLSVLGNLLSRNDRSLIFAQNGTMALDFAKRKGPDLILLDIMMPNMDGFEVCRKLKQDIKLLDIPIIFLTAKIEQDDVVTGLRLGAVDYVTKPFNQEELLTRVNTHLELQTTKKELIIALAEKEEALATKNKFFSIIGHDLGNLFNGLLGFTSLLIEDDVEQEKKNDYIQNIFKAAEKGSDLLKNLLDWSKSQIGNMQVEPVLLVLKDVVSRNVDFLDTKAEAKNITLSFEIQNDIIVFADLNMLNTVIRNLLSNAIKFTKPNGTIKITSEKLGNLIELSIIDDGVGIKTEDINKLFQINMTYTTIGTAEEVGNGLGLILCKEFIEKNGGTIGVESEFGKGSRFYIRIPINA
ncbi:hybrid sensor histidine kinase/response regulator [Candidatus Halobeggiatoa sp. HSG11]|nr:hybrid sensor histidine kinase/response regulator [Candidatus Halobeggiatoa sp. HSG11]